MKRGLTEALGVGVALTAGETDTARLVVPREAGGTTPASVRLADRPTDSVQPVTGLVVSAVLVVLTGDSHTGDVRVPLSPSWADALSRVGDSTALGTTSTRPFSAGRQAVPGNARFVVEAIRVQSAFS